MVASSSLLSRLVVLLLHFIKISPGDARFLVDHSNMNTNDLSVVENSPSTPPSDSNGSSKFHFQPLWVAVGFLIPAVPLLLWWLLTRLRRRRLGLSKVRSSSKAGLTVFSPVIMLPDQLELMLEKLDGGTAGLAVIGRGGCGEVYKAELVAGDSRVAVAIKKIIQPAIGAAELCEEESKVLNCKMRQIRSEIQTVGRMRHPNLLPLLAHVSRPSCHYLVYEFMSNGSLHDSIRGARTKLDWPARYNVALGVATGLEYLHMVHRPRVVHRDLKPANILLDGYLNARISDFGLAKVVPESVSGGMRTKVAGTVGYIAPEYHQTLLFTDKCDVYSLGVILAVLVTGRFPTDEFFAAREEMGMVSWIRREMRSAEPRAAIDGGLLGNGFEEQMLLALKIACFCTYDDPKQRPNSREVRLMLSQIKH